MEHSPEANNFFQASLEWADTGSEKIAYRKFGSGPPLILIHGFPLSGFTWRKLIPELSRNWTCYVPDVPGLGATEWSESTDFSFPGQGKTMHRFVDAIGVEQFSVMGQDTGGCFSRFLALSAGKRVNKLIVINSELPGHRPPFVPLYQLLMRAPGSGGLLRAVVRSRLLRRSALGFGGCFNDLSLIEGEFHEQFIQRILASEEALTGIRKFLIGAEWAPVDALKKDHARLKMPVRFIWGEDDPTFPVNLAERTVGQFPNADLVRIPGAKLLVHEEKPAEVVDAVVEFLV